MKNDKCRWGILGLGSIATTFANDLKCSKYGILQGVASRTYEHALNFGKKFGCTASANYDALIERDDIDAIYIATPHISHFELSYKCMLARKPTLCEKPLTINYGQTLKLFGQAKRNKTLLVEALMYLIHPRMQLARDLIQQGRIGQPRKFSASFGFEFPYNEKNAKSRLYNPSLAGGSILDVGIYPLSAALFLLGPPNSLNNEFGRLTPEGIDIEAKALLHYNECTAQLHSCLDKNLPLRIRIDGPEATMMILDAWSSNPQSQDIIVIDNHKSLQVYASVKPRSLYAEEADHFAELMQNNKLESDIIPAGFSLNTAFWLDRWREKIGVQYTADKLGYTNLEMPKYPKESDTAVLIPRTFYPPLQKDLSSLVLGTDNQLDEITMSTIADAFVQAGGNVFDTAYVYSQGLGETLLGKWMKSRGFQEKRSELIIIGKGAHPPECKPEFIKTQLNTTLERLQTSYLDIYFLHRDDQNIPVGEWIEALNVEYRAGRVKQLGGSNWTAKRVDLANEYAKKNGLVPISVISNNFSLARMINPVWPGCIASSDNDMRQWHETIKTPVFAWSSQARGFFLDWITQGLTASKHGADPTINELRRVWVSDENLERRKRAYQLSEELKMKPIQIALAYVFAQSFPVFALIGARTIDQLDESVAGSNLILTEQQMKWLDLRD